MTRTIPVYSALAGTGFLASGGNATWLVTAGHTMTKCRHSTKDWSQWPDSLHVHFADGTNLAIALFSPERRPLFNYANDGISGTKVEDSIAIKLNSDQLKMLSAFRAFPIGDFSTNDGDEATMIGFPDFGARYPNIPPERAVSGRINGYGHQMIGLDVLSKGGLSGGPVLSGGRLIGSVSGNTLTDDNRGLVVSFEEVGSRLFI